MVEKWDPVPGPSELLQNPWDPRILPEPPGTLETPSDLRGPAEPLGTPKISLEPPWNHRYSSGCDT